MPPTPDPHLGRRVRRMADSATALAALTGGLVLLGWATDRALLTQVLPGLPAIVPEHRRLPRLAGR